MKNFKRLMVSLCVLAGIIGAANGAFAKVVLDDIKLPEPVITGGMPLMEALKTGTPAQSLQNRRFPFRPCQIFYGPLTA